MFAKNTGSNDDQYKASDHFRTFSDHFAQNASHHDPDRDHRPGT